MSADQEFTKPQEPLQLTTYSDVEKEMMDKGWIPKDQFKGPEEEFIPAEDFKRNYTWLVHNSKLKRQIDEQKKAIDYLVDHNKKVEEMTRQRVHDELLAQQRQAASVGDTEKVIEITKKLTEQPKNQPIVQPDVSDFMARNSSWFNDLTGENQVMKQYAIAYEDTLARTNPGLSVSERLRQVEDEIKSRFHDKLGSVERSKPSPVATGKGGSNKPVSNSHDLDTSILSPLERNLMENLQKNSKNFDPQVYLAQVKALKNIQ